MNLFNLFAKLSLDDSEYEKGLDKAGKQASSFSSKASVAFKAVGKAITAVVGIVTAATAAFAKLSTSTINFGDDIDKTSQKLGLSAEAYQKWSLAAQMAGAEVSTLQTGIRQLTQFTQDLADGNGDALLSLQNLGIGYADFMNAGFDDQLKMVVEALQSVENQTDRTRLAQQLFGSRAYQELMPLLNQEAGSLDELFDKFEELGYIMSDEAVDASAELRNEITLMQHAWKMLGISLGTELYPQFDLIINGLTGLANGSEDAFDKLTEGVIGIVEKAAEKLPDILAIASDILFQLIDVMANVIASPTFISGIVGLLEYILNTAIEVLPSVLSALVNVIPILLEALLNLDWARLVINIINVLTKIGADVMPNAAISIIDTLFRFVTSGEGLKKLGQIGLAIAQGIINSLISGVESGINLIVKGINAITGGVSKIWTWLGIPEIPKIPEVSLPKLSFFANGGMLDDLLNGKFSAAIMGENGKAEIVAEGSRGTGVTNVEQFKDASVKALDEYGFDTLIGNAVTGIVNGLADILTSQQGNGYAMQQKIVLQAGNKTFDAYVVDVTNSNLKQQGRKSLDSITRY